MVYIFLAVIVRILLISDDTPQLLRFWIIQADFEISVSFKGCPILLMTLVKRNSHNAFRTIKNIFFFSFRSSQYITNKNLALLSAESERVFALVWWSLSQIKRIAFEQTGQIWFTKPQKSTAFFCTKKKSDQLRTFRKLSYIHISNFFFLKDSVAAAFSLSQLHQHESLV